MWHPPETVWMIVHDQTDGSRLYSGYCKLCKFCKTCLNNNPMGLSYRPHASKIPTRGRLKRPAFMHYSSSTLICQCHSPHSGQGIPYELSLFRSFMPKLTGSVVHSVPSELDLFLMTLVLFSTLIWCFARWSLVDRNT